MAELTLEAYKAAELQAARAMARQGFLVHAVVTAAVSVIVVVVNVTVATGFPWSVFPVAGMGIGLFFHWYFGVLRGAAELERHQEDIEHQAYKAA